MIKIVPPRSWSPLARAIKNLSQYHWLLFTSANGVDMFFKRLLFLGYDTRALSHLRIGVIGTATAERLSSFGLRADRVADEFTSEGLMRKFQRLGVKDRRFLYPRANIGREVIPQKLTRLGAKVECVVVYRIEKERVPANTLNGAVDFITFTSSQTVRNFVEVVPARQLRVLKRKAKAVCIGPVTAQTAKELGFQKCLVARQATTQDLVRAIVKG